MTTIEAKVIGTSEQSIQLTAPRQGGCSKCAQKKHCALTWHPDSKTAEQTSFSLANSASSNQQKHKQEPYAVGDTITLTCNEQQLLRYIGLLFLPSLVMLFVFVLLLQALFPEQTPVVAILATLFISLASGAFISRLLLTKYASRLLTSTITAVS